MRTAAWGAVAALAFAVLAVGALWSPPRGGSLGSEAAAGLLRDTPPEALRRVEVRAGERRLSLAADDPRAALGLRLLRQTAPERSFDRAEPAFGLDAPALVVSVTGEAGAPLLEVAFGNRNPIGLARYARAGPQVVLLPDDVAEAFGALLSTP